MATVDDIDAKAAVRKFLERVVVVDREDQTADSGDEIQSVLESVAVSFLLFPQAALSFVLLAKNALQQVLKSELDIVDYLVKAVGDISNPTVAVTDTSDLIEAQTALVEVDRIGRVSSDVRAYDRYTAAVNRFLDKRLAISLKRRRRNEFERSGNEAKQDLFRVLSAFTPIHTLMAQKLAKIVSSVSDFEGVDLTKIVSTKTVAKVRTSLQKLLNGIDRASVSNTVVALELLAGSAALQSISNIHKIYDPTVSTGTFPKDRIIQATAEQARAFVSGTVGVIDISGLSTPWIFSLVVDPAQGGGTPFAVTLPHSGASGRAWVASKRPNDALAFNIPAGAKTLYVQLDGLAAPPTQPALVKTVTLPTGVQTVAALVSAINSALTPDAFCIELAPGSNRFLIYGSAPVTKVTMRTTYPGSFDLITGIYTPAPAPANSVLGFQDDQASSTIGYFSPEQLTDLLGLYVSSATFSVVGGAPRVRSNLAAPASSLSFSGVVAAAFGFSGLTRSNPGYLILVEGGQELDPVSLGVFLGSVVDITDPDDPTRSISAPVDSIDGTHLLFGATLLPRVLGANVIVNTPTVRAVQTVISEADPYVGSFDGDGLILQRLLSPLLSLPTLAQVNDALAGLQTIRTRISSLRDSLTAVVLREDQTDLAGVVQNIISSLEERGLDRSVDLLAEGSFSLFFSLTMEDSSKSSRFMKAIEQVGRRDLPTVTIEDQIPDLRPRGSTPTDDILQGENLLNDGEEVV